jgi:heme O synthase-like polyprenyltransferase
MSRPGKVKALLATLRIANAPSVVSNVFLGCLLGGYHPKRLPGGQESYELLLVAITCLAGVSLYFAGNLANDWFDREWDAIKRPERALPRGFFQPRSYLGFAILLAATGVSLVFLTDATAGAIAIGIVASIGVYTAYHKKAMWPVVPMGLCRALLYALGYFAMAPFSGTIGEFTLVCLCSGLFSYIVGLSLSARYEGMADAPHGPKVISLAMLILPVMSMSCMFMDHYEWETIAGIIPFAIWLGLCLTRFRKPIPRYVSALLAGIPLVDLIAMVPIVLGVMHLSRPLEVTYLAVPIVAFILGRALQKLAPAT